jgi:hypothetical protein
MAKFSPIFFFLFAISFGRVASNSNEGSDVVNAAEQIINTKGGDGGEVEYQTELAAKQTLKKRGVVKLTLNEIGEIIKFLEETFTHDYFMVLRMGVWEKVLIVLCHLVFISSVPFDWQHQ